MFKRTGFVFAALTLAVGAQAATLPEAQVLVCAATPATLPAVVKGLAANTSARIIAQALMNCSKDFDAVIASMRGAGVPDIAISNTLYELVPADKLASLDLATLNAGLPLPATGAGRNSPGTAPGVGNGNGATIAPFVSGGNAFGGGGRGNASTN